ncbi:MAG: XRE family transcriptional regulator [Chloroflexi bacterium]|nr:XRE family transcriptional regulator [Chloroflexota bacterium]
MHKASEVESFGGLLRACRLALGLTQEALAERSSVSVRSIQSFEADGARPRTDTARQLADALELSPERRTQFDAAAAPAPRRIGRRRRMASDGALADVGPAESALGPPAELAAARQHRGLVALPGSSQGNLPRPLSSLLGREADLVAIRGLIGTAHERLVTLTGVGGSGKTLLAIHAAAALSDLFADGVWLVELGPIADPSLVSVEVAAALGVREALGTRLLDALRGVLRRKRLLLLLDNCEHLIDACATLAERLLTACPSLVMLATSREPLRVAGERRWRVEPLQTPERSAPPDVLADYPSVRLFVERARAAEPGFALTPENAVAVTSICRRLDGIPLAIELAAARVGVLAVEQLDARLDDCFRLLVGGARAGPARQRTMRATLDWSYDLLEPSDQVVFGRLAVFAGGCDLEAAEAVVRGDVSRTVASPTAHEAPRPEYGSPPFDTLATLGRLVDKSLVVVERLPATTRYRLLEPIRQYAGELVAHRDDGETVRARHANWYLALAERAAPALRGPAQVGWLSRLAADQDNLRVALHWAAGHGDATRLARLAIALAPWWEVWGALSEGRHWFSVAMSMAGRLSGDLRARLLLGAGRLAFWQVDLEAAATQLRASLDAARGVDDLPGVAAAITWLGAARGAQGAFDAAHLLLDDGMAMHELLGDAWGVAWAKCNLGRCLGNRGTATRDQSDFAQAATVLEESVRQFRALGDIRFGAVAETYLGIALLRLGERERSAVALKAGLEAMWAVGDRAYLLPSLTTLALVAALTGQPDRSARLLGGVEAVAEALGATLAPVNRVTRDEVLAVIRTHLDPSTLDVNREAGRALAIHQVMVEALAVADEAATAGVAC